MKQTRAASVDAVRVIMAGTLMHFVTD